jgi:hypothetical protein
VHARHAAAAPGAARPATPAELVAVALSPLSCSREPRTLPAAFLVVRSYCPHALVAAGSVEQALSNKMGGARLLPWERRTAAALDSRGRASGLKGRLMAKPWVMGERRPSPDWPGWASARICLGDPPSTAVRPPAALRLCAGRGRARQTVRRGAVDAAAYGHRGPPGRPPSSRRLLSLGAAIYLRGAHFAADAGQGGPAHLLMGDDWCFDG